ILPATLTQPIDRSRGESARVGALEYQHPVFEVFRAPRSGDFSTARFYAYRSVIAAPNTQVLARFDAGTPALVERKVGSGHVMLWASTLDLSWSDLPLKPVFLPFIHRSMVHLANYTEPAPWLTIGEVFDPDESSATAQASGRLRLAASGRRRSDRSVSGGTCWPPEFCCSALTRSSRTGCRKPKQSGVFGRILEQPCSTFYDTHPPLPTTCLASFATCARGGARGWRSRARS